MRQGEVGGASRKEGLSGRRDQGSGAEGRTRERGVAGAAAGDGLIVFRRINVSSCNFLVLHYSFLALSL